MNWRTHEYLGRLMATVLREKWGDLIDERKFVEGCIKPDMTALFVTHPHFWKISKKYILRKIDHLERKTPHLRGKKKFSEQLGIVAHYVADFFTSAHNTVPNRILEHIAFEDELHQRFLSTVTADVVRTLLASHPDKASSRHSSASRYLARTRSEYAANMSDCAKDIEPIIRVCINLTSMILASAAKRANRETDFAAGCGMPNISNLVITSSFAYTMYETGGIVKHA